MKIPFDVKYKPQIESGEYKVQTNDGADARIICWDAEGSQRKDDIVALVKGSLDAENIQRYYVNGKLISDSGRRGNKDLVIVTPKEELTPFEEELATIIGFAISQSVTVPDKEMATFVKEWSEKLLSVVRQQLTPKFGKEYEAGYLDGFNHGKAEALKDLPRWRKIPERNQNYSDKTQFVINGRYLEMSDTITDVYEVSLSDLEKLPKFKED